jgi:hypothetical protein
MVPCAGTAGAWNAASGATGDPGRLRDGLDDEHGRRRVVTLTAQPLIWSDGTPVQVVGPLKQLYVDGRITLDELEDLTERALLELPLVVYR